MQENNRGKLIFAIIFNLIFSILLGFFVFQVVVIAGCFTESQKLPFRNWEIMRILIYGSSDSNGFQGFGDSDGDTVSARISLLDTSGFEISQIERSWQGSYLSVDFCSTILNGNHYYFPYSIKGTESIIQKKRFSLRRKGTLLYPYFMEDGKCLLYSTFEGREARKALFKAARFADKPGFLCFSKYVSDMTVNLSLCESGVYYGIYITDDGCLILRAE